jgi:hypothetical protein
LPQVIDPPMALAMTRAYHNWLYVLCGRPQRWKGVVVVAPRRTGSGPGAGRCVRDYGFVGAFVAPILGQELDERCSSDLERVPRLDIRPWCIRAKANAAGTSDLTTYAFSSFRLRT